MPTYLADGLLVETLSATFQFFCIALKGHATFIGIRASWKKTKYMDNYKGLMVRQIF